MLICRQIGVGKAPASTKASAFRFQETALDRNSIVGARTSDETTYSFSLRKDGPGTDSPGACN